MAWQAQSPSRGNGDGMAANRDFSRLESSTHFSPPEGRTDHWRLHIVLEPGHLLSAAASSEKLQSANLSASNLAPPW
jgi:hypothetical protein